MNHFQATINETKTSDLLRAYFSNKEYIVFDISVFNVGTSINLICTDNYVKYQYIGKDGYSFIIENNYDENEVLRDELLKRLKKISNQWTVICYNMNWTDYLKSVGLSDWNYQRLLKIERNNI